MIEQPMKSCLCNKLSMPNHVSYNEHFVLHLLHLSEGVDLWVDMHYQVISTFHMPSVFTCSEALVPHYGGPEQAVEGGWKIQFSS